MRGDANGDASSYIATGMKTVNGWFEPIDAHLVKLCSDLQGAAGVSGDLLEVGAAFGCSAILLGYLGQPDEKLLVCDLWGDPAPTDANAVERARFYPESPRPHFEANYRRFHAELPQMLDGPSTTVLPKVPADSCRLVHVDGSHAYGTVLSDIVESKRILGPDGVLVLDDLMTRHTPGVGAAAWFAVRELGLVPLVTTLKMYATWGHSDVVSVDAVRAAIDAHAKLTFVAEHDVAGHRIVEPALLPDRDGVPWTAARIARGVLRRARII